MVPNLPIQLPGELTISSITLEELFNTNSSIQIIYKYKNLIQPPELQKHIDTVLRMASDGLCNICHEMNIDPNILNYWHGDGDYIVTPFQPQSNVE